MVACAAFFIAPALAQMVCGKHADIVKRLTERFQEKRSGSGLGADGNLVELFTAKSGGWTILLTKPGGLTCLVAVGEHWRIEKPSI